MEPSRDTLSPRQNGASQVPGTEPPALSSRVLYAVPDAPGWHGDRKRKVPSVDTSPMTHGFPQRFQDRNARPVDEEEVVHLPKRPRMNASPACPRSSIPTDRSKLPLEIWHHIFTFLPPFTLGRLLRVNKVFNASLTPKEDDCPVPTTSQGVLKTRTPAAIWIKSRNNTFPNVPRPLNNMSELEMWRLIGAAFCQFCKKRPDAGASSDKPASEKGPSFDGVRIIWPFAIRTCVDCFLSKTQKEVDLVLSPFPALLIPALPFCLATPSLDIISSVALRSNPLSSDLEITKYYYTPHITKLLRDLEEVKTLGYAAVEEWIKGQEVEGKRKMSDTERWEQWEAGGGLLAVRREGPHFPDRYEPPLNLGSALGTTSAGRQADKKSPGDRTSDVHGQEFSRSATSHTSQVEKYDGPALPQQARPEPSLHDATEAKAARRAEIERRCAELSPPLTPALLSHMDSFTAAIQIPHPLSDKDWEILKPRLLAQRGMAEKKEQDRPQKINALQGKSDERLQQESRMKEAKASLEREWDDAQQPVRDQVALYAQEVIDKDWKGGSAVTKDKCPRFAADVLIQVRKKFYAHIKEEDTLARASGKPIKVDPPNAPPTRILTLENLKWVFNVKVKPLTEKYHQREIFLCNGSGCEKNFKYYALEGVIQHYAAKHTTDLSRGSMVVYWRAEWPEKPPFQPNPDVPRGKPHKAGHSAQASGTGHYLMTPEQRHRTLGDHQSPRPYGPSPFRAPYPYSQGPYQPPSPSISPYFPASNAGYVYPPPPTANPTTSYESNTSQLTYASPHMSQARPANHQSLDSRPPQAHSSSGQGTSVQTHVMGSESVRDANVNLSDYRKQLDELARAAREVWNATTKVKNLQNCVRAYVLIFHVIISIRRRFGHDPTIALFVDGLNNHPKMKPIQSLSGVACKICTEQFHKAKTRKGWPRPTHTYHLPALVSHFQSMHLEHDRRRSGVDSQREGALTSNWGADMVFLPSPSFVKTFLHGLDRKNPKSRLLVEAFHEGMPLRLDPPATDTHTEARPLVQTNKSSGPHHPPSQPSIAPPSRRVDDTSTSPKQYPSTQADHQPPTRYTMPQSSRPARELSEDRRAHEAQHEHRGVVSQGNNRDSLVNLADRDFAQSGLAYDAPQVPDSGDGNVYHVSRVQPLAQQRYQARFDGPKSGTPVQGSTADLYDAYGRRYVRHSPNLYEARPLPQLASRNAQMELRPRHDELGHPDKSGLPEDKVHVKKEHDEEASAADRFLDSLAVGQELETDRHQSNGSHSEIKPERTSSHQGRHDFCVVEDLQRPHYVHYGGPTEHVSRGSPASYADGTWVRGAHGPHEGEIRLEPHDQVRPTFRRSPDVVHVRYSRKVSGVSEVRRSGSRFERYEAQRQESLRPRSRSPSMQEGVIHDGHFPDEPSSQHPVRPRSVYGDHGHPRHQRVEMAAYSRAAPAEVYRYVEDVSMEPYYDDTIEYVPPSATRYVERTLPHDPPRTAPYEVVYTAQDHADLAHGGRGASPISQSAGDVPRRVGQYH